MQTECKNATTLTQFTVSQIHFFVWSLWLWFLILSLSRTESVYLWQPDRVDERTCETEEVVHQISCNLCNHKAFGPSFRLFMILFMLFSNIYLSRSYFSIIIFVQSTYVWDWDTICAYARKE